MKKIIYYLSLLGIVLLVIYVLPTFINLEIFPVEDYYLFFHFYTLGLFLIAIFSIRKNGKNNKIDIKVSMKKRPPWLKYFFYFTLFYGMIVFFAPKEGIPEKMEEGYAMVYRGRVLEELTEDEYETQKWMQKRSSTGHWLIFLTAAALMTYKSEE